MPYAVYRPMLLGLLLLMLAACTTDTADVIPTLAQPDQIATDVVLTENAPPPGYDEVSFPRIDDNLRELPGWQYDMALEFNGTFAGTPRQTAVTNRATVSFNQLQNARRVVAEFDNDLQEAGDPTTYEAVRLGNDAFLLRDDQCLTNASADAALAADFSAGDLLGGVQRATTAAQTAVINSEEAWRYGFTVDDLMLPNVTFTDDSRILSLQGELWVAPEHEAVVRYYVNLDAENFQLLDSPLPVSGQLILRYDLYNVGDAPNISVPFGC